MFPIMFKTQRKHNFIQGSVSFGRLSLPGESRRVKKEVGERDCHDKNLKTLKLSHVKDGRQDRDTALPATLKV